MTLDFEGIVPLIGPVADFYDGNGGPDLGIVFGATSTVITPSPEWPVPRPSRRSIYSETLASTTSN